jgi:hypothetical protein
MKTKLYKAALLAALGLSSITAAQAGTTDVLLGFNDAAGTGNDYVIDLGNPSLFTTTAVLSYGINSSLFTTAFSADSSYLNNVAVGVVEGNQSSPSTLFMTGLTTPAAITQSEVVGAAAYAGGAAVGEYSSGSTTGWSYNVAPSPTTLLAPAAGSSVGSQTGINPLSNLAGGLATINLYENTATTGRGGSVSGWTEVGTFAVNVNTDVVTFNGVDAVPEPSTCSLFGGAGLLVLLFRRKLNRKNA